MCFLIQKHVFIQFVNNQKLLIQFNQIDVIVGKSLVKDVYNILYIILLISFEERRKILKRKQGEGSIIEYRSVNSNMQGTRHFVRISVCS